MDPLSAKFAKAFLKCAASIRDIKRVYRLCSTTPTRVATRSSSRSLKTSMPSPKRVVPA